MSVQGVVIKDEEPEAVMDFDIYWRMVNPFFLRVHKRIPV